MYKTIKYSTAVTGSIKADGTAIGPPVMQIKLRFPDVIQSEQKFRQEVDKILKDIRAELEGAFREVKEKL